MLFALQMILQLAFLFKLLFAGLAFKFINKNFLIFSFSLRLSILLSQVFAVLSKSLCFKRAFFFFGLIDLGLLLLFNQQVFRSKLDVPLVILSDVGY
jgi:hypothetical protein